MLEISVLLDFIKSLAILAMMSVMYSRLHRVDVLVKYGQVETVLGLLFGLVTVMQMYSPLNLAPGVIIDMRNVAIAIAGAFLGGRGLLACLLIAVAVRLQIGGVGAASGIIAMLISALMGLVWSSMTLGRYRGFGSAVLLGLAVPFSLVAIVFLPYDIALKIWQTVAFPLTCIYVLSIPLITLLMEQARQAVRMDRNRAGADLLQPGTTLMGQEALEWSLAQAADTGSLRAGATIVTMRIRFQGALARVWGQDADQIAMRVFHDRLQRVMPAGGVVGWAANDLVVMAIPKVAADDAQGLLAKIRREVSENVIRTSGYPPFRLSLDLGVVQYDTVPSLQVIKKEAGLQRSEKTFSLTQSSTATARVNTAPDRPPKRRRPLVAPAVGDGDLFATFDILQKKQGGTS